MSEESNNKDKNPDLNRVEEPFTAYNSEKIYTNIEDHPLFAKVIEKSLKEAEERNGFTTEQVMKMTRERYPFLK